MPEPWTGLRSDGRAHVFGDCENRRLTPNPPRTAHNQENDDE